MKENNIGALIRELRVGKNMTQRRLAEMLCVSDRTVSKWERGAGMPDLSLLPGLSEILGIDMQSLVSGTYEEGTAFGGSLKKMSSYVCPVCKNIVWQLAGAGVSCCAHKLVPLIPVKNSDGVKCERIENEWFISSPHEMTKENYVSFAAFVTGDTVIFKKLYPQWSFEVRIPYFAHGTFYWYSEKDGLMYRYL